MSRRNKASKMGGFIVAQSLGLWLAFLTPAFAGEQDALEDILKRIQVQETLQLEYQETRHMELLNRPRQSNGQMFLSAEKMVIAQHSPKLQTTVISKNKVLHIDPARNIRRDRKLKKPFAIPGMGPFLQLFYGQSNLAELEQQFSLKLVQDGSLWQLNLFPKITAMSRIRTAKLSGNPGEGPNRLVLEFADGDQTEWRLSPLARGPDARKAMDKILAQTDRQTSQ